MAFMGMVFGVVAIVIFIVILLFMIAFLITATILKTIGKIKDSRPMRIAGNVFLVLGIINAIPVVLIIGSIIFDSFFTKVSLPDGKEAYVSLKDISIMQELAVTDSDDAMDELDELLSESPNLVYYLDANVESVLDYGLENGNSEVVEIALNNGAIYDDPQRYDRMAYVHNSMDYYLDELISREITEDDVRIIELMFENGASTNYKNSHYSVYSNLFGKAVWAVLYNDEAVTDTEIEFIQVFINNDLKSDNGLLLYEEKPNNVIFSSEYHADVLRDDNYNRIMTILGR